MHNPDVIDSKDLAKFLEKFKVLNDVGVISNSIFYILNLNTMSYEYINDTCATFAGVKPEEFYNKGMKILPEIIIENDFNLLADGLFPKMNEVTKSLSQNEKQNVSFEIYYKMKNRESGEITQIAEFSSYTKFDVKGNPMLSTGICYKSIKKLEGVRGIVRLKDKMTQHVLFDKSLALTSNLLTKSENEIADLLIQGLSRKEIATYKNISKHTVDSHIKKVYKKLSINKVSELRDHV